MSTAHISPNTIQGSLRDASLQRLLDGCKKSLVTGRIDIDADGHEGRIELRAGAVNMASFGELSGAPALERLRLLGDGTYEISQRLPDLGGELGSSASFSGELKDVRLVDLMRHCEDNALTCHIVIIHEFDRGEIDYKCGEIARVRYNGAENEDRIVDMVRLKDARFLVTAPPLDVRIDGWPVVRRDPTAPFQIEHLASRPRARAARAAPVPRLETRPGDLHFYALDDDDFAIPGGEIVDVGPDIENKPDALVSTGKPGGEQRRREPRERRYQPPPRPRGLRGRLAMALRRAGHRLGNWAERLATPPIIDIFEVPKPRVPKPRMPKPRIGWLRRLFGARARR